MSDERGIRISNSAGGVRVDLLWWRGWEGPPTVAAAVGLALWVGLRDRVALAVACAAGAAVAMYWYSLTVEADRQGVSFHRWHSPGRRYPWRDIADVTVQKRKLMPTGESFRRRTVYYCTLVLKDGTVVRINPGDSGRSQQDAELIKAHIDQVRGLWDLRLV